MARSIAWSDMDPVEPELIARTQFASPQNQTDTTISDATLNSVLNDEDHRIQSDFHIHPEFQTPTRFWLKIYTQYSTKDVVIYDSKNMNLIYEVVDLRPIQKRSRNAVVFEILSERKIKKTLQAYQKAFLALAKNPKPKNPTREQSLILQATAHQRANGQTGSFHWKEMATQLKSMKGQRDPIVHGLLAGETLFPKMEQIFKQAQVPIELTRLCLVESSFNIRAGSKVGASGLWQIMPKVGHQYLKMNERIGLDERYSALKSTVAAAKLLKFNYKILGSWLLAVVAYNHGFKGLPRFKPENYEYSKIAYLFQPQRGKKAVLGWASQNYYAEYMAILYASFYEKELYGEFPRTQTPRPMEFVKLTEPKTGLQLIREHGLETSDFLAYNTELKDLRQPLPVGLWIAYPGKTENFNEFLQASFSKPKASPPLMARLKRKKHLNHGKTKTARA
ncbi:MAG: lytic transglycosylase domain-containing protein [Bdellovibrionia bacterium]